MPDADDFSNEYEAITGLADTVRNTPNQGQPFASGNVAICPHVRPKSIPVGSIETVSEWSPSSLQRVAAVCKQSPFGRGEETVVDENVRKALEMQAADISIDNIGEWDAQLKSKILPKAVSQLYPGVPATCFMARLHKMTLYQQGSFFHAHRDTQYSDDHFGTLVVMIPSRCVGGQLSLRHGDVTKAFEAKKKCVWVAFFADVEHEVLKVKSGHRISLLYHLYRQGHVDIPRPSPTAAADARASVDALVNAVKGLAARTNECLALTGEAAEHVEKSCAVRSIGFVLRHVYGGSVTPKTLKTSDGTLYRALEEAGLPIRFIPIEMYVSGTGWDEDGYCVRTIHGLSDNHVIEIYEVTPDASHRRMVHVESHGSELGYYESGYDAQKIQFLERDLFALVRSARAADKRIEGTGNEGSAASYRYKRMAMVVDIASADETYYGKWSQRDGHNCSRYLP